MKACSSVNISKNVQLLFQNQLWFSLYFTNDEYISPSTFLFCSQPLKQRESPKLFKQNYVYTNYLHSFSIMTVLWMYMHLQKLEVPKVRKDLTSHHMLLLYCHAVTLPSFNALTVSKKEVAGVDKSLYAPSTSRYRCLATKSEVEERRL